MIPVSSLLFSFPSIPLPGFRTVNTLNQCKAPTFCTYELYFAYRVKHMQVLDLKCGNQNQSHGFGYIFQNRERFHLYIYQLFVCDTNQIGIVCRAIQKCINTHMWNDCVIVSLLLSHACTLSAKNVKTFNVQCQNLPYLFVVTMPTVHVNVRPFKLLFSIYQSKVNIE